MWTLQELFEEYNRRDLYASASFVARIDGAPLGFGSMRSTLQAGSDEQVNVPSSTVLDSASAEKEWITDEVNSSAIPSTSQPTPSVTSPDTATQLERRGLDIRLNYTPSGILFSEYAFIDSIIYFLVLAANRDPKTSTTKIARSYNIDEGFFIEVSSIDDENEMEVGTIIEVLGRLPVKMYEQRDGGRWAELQGLVKYDGVNIGRIRVEPGSPLTTASSNQTDGQRVRNDSSMEFCMQKADRGVL